MNRHIREDLVHGDQGDKLRSTSIVISGDGPVAASLRMLVAKAGYRNLTLVIEENTLTDEDILQDPLLKLEDVGSSRLHVIRKRFNAVSTAEQLSLKIVERVMLCPADLEGNEFVLMADNRVIAIEELCRDRIPVIFGIATSTGYRVDFMPPFSSSKGYFPLAPIEFHPTRSLMAASRMLSLLQQITLSEEKKLLTTHFDFPNTYRDKEEVVVCLPYTDSFPDSRKTAVSIAVIGCGAIGSHVTQLLASIGYSKVTLVDFDDIREHNLSRLCLAEASDIGKNKATMLRDRVEDRYGWRYTCIKQQIEYIPEGRLIDHDMILCCTDRNTARRYLAGISRLKNSVIFVQGGFGNALHQITTGTEIDAIFNQPDNVKNSCTGLNMYEDPSNPIGATQATVGMVAACMVEAAQRLLHGDSSLKDRFFTWGFPNLVHTVALAPPSSIHPRIHEIEIPDGRTSVRDFLQQLDDLLPGHFMMMEHPFIIEWECLGGCGKPIRIGRYQHDLSDSDRFHAECLKGNEHLLHVNMAQQQLVVYDRISLESDDHILSLSVEEIGLMDDSIRRICGQDGRMAAVRLKYAQPEHFSLIIEESALIDMTQHGMEIVNTTGHEAAGLLFGEVNGHEVHVTTFVPAEVETSNPCYVQISTEWMARKLYEYESTSLRLCGWWHTHPGFGLRPSNQDIKTFAYFPSKQHFSLIQDPTATEYSLAVYQYSDGDINSRDFQLHAKDGRILPYKKYKYGR